MVKKDDQRDTSRTLRQRTLTQVGYALQQPLEGYSLDIPEGNEEGAGGKNKEKHAEDTKHSFKGATHKAGMPRETGHGTSAKYGTQESSIATAFFHTQTLAQLVAERGDSRLSTANGDSSFDATICDSQEECSFNSLDANTKVAANDTLQYTTSPRHLFSTPKAQRVEIPSSQPSPFTPMLLLDRYHSSLGHQQTSPLSGKSASKSILTADSSDSTFLRAQSDQPKYTMTKRDNSEGYLKLSMPKALPISEPENPKETRAPLRSLRSPEVTIRSGHQNFPEHLGSVVKLDVQIPQTPSRGSNTGPRAKLGGQCWSKKRMWSSEEIPDSDEECDRLSEALGPSQDFLSATKPNHPTTDDADSDTASSRLSSVPSSPASPRLVSPSPLLRRRNITLVSPHAKAPFPTMSQYMQHATTQSTETQQLQSQGLESQRVSLDVIRSLGPQTDRSDIIISVHPEHIRYIASGDKDHEFRNYKIPHTVGRFWLYATRPACELQYMAVVAPGFRQPGEIDGHSGVGNAEFNAGQPGVWFAYKLVQVYQLNNPVPLAVMKRNGWVDGPPQRYTYVPPAVVGALLGNLRCALFGEARNTSHNDTNGDRRGEMSSGESWSISQEIEAQLLSELVETQPSQMLEHRYISPVCGEKQSETATIGEAPLTNIPRAKKPRLAYTVPSQVRADSRGVDNAYCPDHGKPILWPSLATTAICPLTQDIVTKGASSSKLYTADLQTQIASSPTDKPPAKLDSDTSSEPPGVDGNEPPFGRQYSSQVKDLEYVRYKPPRRPQQSKSQQQQPPTHSASHSSMESTQIFLPDSLYEEVRQAPPAIVPDSEDSEGSERM